MPSRPWRGSGICLLHDVGRGDHIVDLEDHLHHLSGQAQLTALGRARLIDTLLPHVGGAHLHAVHAMPGVLSGLLQALHCGHLTDRTEATVFGQGHGNRVQSLGKGFHAVLVDGLLLVRRTQHRQRRRHLTGTAARHDARVTDQIPHTTVGVMEASLRLIHHHLISTPDQDRHSLRLVAPLNHQHGVLGCSEGDLTHNARLAQFFCSNLLEARHDPATCGDCNQLQLHSANPPHSWKFRLVEQMVGLIIKAPLADHQVATGGLDVLDLLPEVGLLNFVHLLVVLA
mmetsp:Transcript_21367/g.34167  ORF Transcript_21367/g.34167 Transcript_21367/m.34167 type:complete len:285 (+) Transcript_21367:206-1060(+)